ncbi:MAG: acetyl-CoA carboxylase, biotin carboxyl carrier protein [Verrucomicrobiales bacterium]|nr:acetyl-CoA carboxylase, biotin carboxyl carrier protein [Verrucomicrobiales bacterium]|tara:strand:- start:141 stop:599 length:459 start_codon:yes stop_codon:yes gene_type:complete
MDLKEIKAIVDLMKKNSITEFELDKEQFKIKLKRATASAPAQQVVEAAPAPAQLPAPAATPAAPTSAAPAASDENEIKSPMIGTFYSAPSPDAAPYVEVGTEVGPDTVVCIIEAMKVMNEIKAEVRGVVTSMLVDNGKPVEFGQALFKVKPA